MRYIGKLALKKNHVVQKKVKGEEYSIDCFSYNGAHYVIGINKYHFSNPNIKSCQHAGVLDIKCNKNKISSYVFNVLDIADLKNGFSHLEVMYDGVDYYLIELNPRLPGAVGFFSYMDEISYNRSHLEVLIKLLNGEQIRKIPNFSGIYTTTFLLRSCGYEYKHIDVSIIKKLTTFTKLQIIDNTSKKISHGDRLDTIAFVMFSGLSEEAIYEDVAKLQELQNTGVIFAL